jgi:Bax protein
MNLLGFSRKKSWGKAAILLSVSAMVTGLYVLGMQDTSVARVCVDIPAPERHAVSTPESNNQKTPLEETIAEMPYEEVGYTQVKVDTSKELRAVFDDFDYTLTVPEGKDVLEVPRLELISLPGDLATVGKKDKKSLFLRTHLPLILKTNERIQNDRERLLGLLEMQETGFHLRSKDTKWLEELAKKYGLNTLNVKELVRRVDVIPPSLALGQAVAEAGWGVSHAAKRKNSTFGMMRRSTNQVQSYDSLQECVDDYVRNLNCHPAYKGMREIRATQRKCNEEVCSLKLADGLHQYSTRGKSYIREIKQLIVNNDLKKYDGAQLQHAKKSTPLSESFS